MLKQKYIDMLNLQKVDLLKQKSELGFLGKLFFRRYTDWVMTDEIYEKRLFHSFDGIHKSSDTPYREWTVQKSVRMKLSDGSIESRED